MTKTLTNLSVEATRPEEGGVERVWAVGGHDDLHLPKRVKPIKLVQQLQHKAIQQKASALTQMNTKQQSTLNPIMSPPRHPLFPNICAHTHRHTHRHTPP